MVAHASLKAGGIYWTTTVDYDNDDFQNSHQEFDRGGEFVHRDDVPPGIRAKLDAKVQMRIFQKCGAV